MVKHDNTTIPPVLNAKTTLDLTGDGTLFLKNNGVWGVPPVNSGQAGAPGAQGAPGQNASFSLDGGYSNSIYNGLDGGNASGY